MTCESCDCEISETTKALQPLLTKLEKAKFTGRLELTFDHGRISSAKLRHYLAYSEFTKPLVIVEPEKFTLKG